MNFEWRIRPFEKLKTILVNEAMEGVCKIYEEQLKKDRSELYRVFYFRFFLDFDFHWPSSERKKGKLFSAFDYI